MEQLEQSSHESALQQLEQTARLAQAREDAVDQSASSSIGVGELKQCLCECEKLLQLPVAIGAEMPSLHSANLASTGKVFSADSSCPTRRT